MVYAFLQNESIDDSLKRIFSDQIDMAVSGLNNWQGSRNKQTYVSDHVDKIVAVYDLVSGYSTPEFNDQIRKLGKNHRNYAEIYRSTIDLKAFKYLKKVHPDWFKIHPCKMRSAFFTMNPM